MAVGEFYSVPEIDLRIADHEVLGSYICARRSIDKALWLGKQWEEDLAGRRPEELPPCFLAVQVDGLSPRTGWATEHGWWEPKELFVSPGLSELWKAALKCNAALDATLNVLKSNLNGLKSPLRGMWMKTTLVFRPNDGSKSDLTMSMYNVISTSGRYFLEEDIALCHVFRVPKGKRNGVVHSEPQFGYAFDPVGKFGKLYSDLDFSDLPDVNMPEISNFSAEDYGVGGLDPPSIAHPFCVPKKRPRSNPVGGSDVWGSFTKIYTKDPEVVYAACHHCGRMMKLKGGSKCGTKSLSRHNETCPCKPGSSMD